MFQTWVEDPGETFSHIYKGRVLLGEISPHLHFLPEAQLCSWMCSSHLEVTSSNATWGRGHGSPDPSQHYSASAQVFHPLVLMPMCGSERKLHLWLETLWSGSCHPLSQTLPPSSGHWPLQALAQVSPEFGRNRLPRGNRHFLHSSVALPFPQTPTTAPRLCTIPSAFTLALCAHLAALPGGFSVGLWGIISIQYTDILSVYLTLKESELLEMDHSQRRGT